MEVRQLAVSFLFPQEKLRSSKLNSVKGGNIMNKTTTGFTIVELIVVIVVIAILATVSVVGYTSVQNRVHDTAVKSDLTNLAKKIQLVYAETGVYPAAGRRTNDGVTWSGDDNLFPGITFSVAQGSYADTINALSYCTGLGSTDGKSEFRILAKSRSSRFFEYTSMNGLVNRGTAYIPIYEHLALCNGFDSPRSFTYAYKNSATGWVGWAK